MGCSSQQTQPRVIVEEHSELLVCRIPIELPYPEAVQWREVKFFVITPEIMFDILEGNTTEYPDVLIGLSTEGYENLSLNIQQLRAHMLSSRMIIESYRDYYRLENKE